jgi:hypothetical protein
MAGTFERTIFSLGSFEILLDPLGSEKIIGRQKLPFTLATYRI